MINPTLTSEWAKQYIGTLFPSPALPVLDGFDFHLTSSRREWDVRWEFHQRSAYPQQLRHLREVQQQGLQTYDAFQAGLKVLRSNADTRLYTLLSQYEQKAKLTPGYFWERGIEQKPHPILEGLLNAFDHGSNYCQQGNVTLRMLGGNYGALFLIENPRTGFKLPVLDEDELRIKIEETDRGRGISWYKQTKKAFVGTEVNDKVFRLILLYPILER